MPEARIITEAEAFLEERGIRISEMRGWPFNRVAISDLYERSAEERADTLLSGYRVREEFIVRFGFAVITESVIRSVAAYAPLVEVGCGSGYWSYELRKAGVDVIATDPGTGRYRGLLWGEDGEARHWDKPWLEIEPISGIEAVRKYPARNLLTVWPDMAPWADQTLREFKGETVLYGGEGSGGCTADDGFHRFLEERFEPTEVIDLPQFGGIHDDLYVWRRRG